MRNILIRRWIPEQYDQTGFGIKTRVPGTGGMSSDFTYEAKFDSWGLSYDTMNCGNGDISVTQFTTAIIILPDGTVAETAPCNIKFVVDEKQKIEAAAPELLEAIGGLVSLKDWKDEYGRDEYYLSQKPLVWKRANDAIKKATE